MSTTVASTTPPSSSPTLVSVKGDESKKYSEDVNVERKLSANDVRDSDPLPAKLRRILIEVARSGRCSWLSWNGEDLLAAPLQSDGQLAVANTLSADKDNNNNILNLRRRRTATSSASNKSQSKSSSKNKHGNGLHVNRRKYAENGSTKSVGGRKRPLRLRRSPSASSSIFSACSIGSGKTSGSEPDDSTQYECDSEGTSATTNSEFSAERRKTLATVPASQSSIPTPRAEKTSVRTYKSLRDAIRVALALVLDHSYRHRGGYKLSPAEMRRNAAAAAAALQNSGAKYQSETGNAMSGTLQPTGINVTVFSAEYTFMQRRKRLLALLGADDVADAMHVRNSARSAEERPTDTRRLSASDESMASASDMKGPPFTIQRVAEVLLAPERYYTQTHKLCNCLEKLLLITSSTTAFGGTVGGDSSQSRREDREFAALAGERGRQEQDHRSRKIRRRMSSSSSDDAPLDGDQSGIRQSGQHLFRDGVSGDAIVKKPTSPEHKVDSGDMVKHNQGSRGGSSPRSSSNGAAMSPRDYLEATARASLRSKFDHVGMESHSSGAVDRDMRVIAGHRVMTTSPPPPMSGAAPIMQPHGSVGAFVRHLGDHTPGVGDSLVDGMQHHPHIARAPSPIMFSSGGDSGSPIAAIRSNHSIHLLQMHHAAALAGVPIGTMMGEHSDVGTRLSTLATAPDVGYLEMEPGRSSASNSDVDSESDDFSLDDSASDRSDGSDSGSGTPAHYEPFTAARVMALNRMQQQQRLQNRALSTLASYGSHYHQHGGDVFRPPADSEYQSGDSIDSTMAEDSGGSDSSSSDLAD